ncbi:MAG: sensor histidine kinase [Gemmatimonadetes bacterium]|nr:sensor histidine kinase [Gemmatimonadota bacterium]
MARARKARPESPERRRGSLRAELLFNLTFLAVSALLLAVATSEILSIQREPGAASAWAVLVLPVVDVLAFVGLGNYLIDKLVVRPLSEAVQAAQAIAGGDYQRRAVPGGTRETAALANALNRLTDQLLENQARLAENVRSLDDTNRLLIATQRDLVQAEKMASIGRLAAGVAHEVGNPLGALVGYASVLRRRGADADLVDGIERESRRIDRIVRGLLDFARPGPTEREAVDLAAALEHALEVLRAQGKLAGVDVRATLDADLPPVRAFTHGVEQVLVNLLDNADAAMKGEGRITVTAHHEEYRPDRPMPVRRADDPPGVSYAHLRRPRYASSREGSVIEPGTDVVRLVLADTGPGIPREQIDAIFDPFFTTRAPGQGTGLGLAIVAATMADFGGRIEVSSAEGGGAVFTLTFRTWVDDT